MRFLAGRLTPTPKSPAEPSPSSALPQPPPAAAEVKPLTETEEEEEEEEGEEEDAGRGRRRRENGEGGGRSPVCGSAPATSAGTSPSATINLSREYTLAIQTNSYNEIWSKIHDGEEEEEGEGEGDDGVGRVLQPDRASIEKVLRSAPPTHFARLVSDYLDCSEHTCRLCLSLQRAVGSARSLYCPIRDLLELLPAGRGLDPHLTQAQCDWAFDTFLQFDRLDNPFPAPSASFHFQGTRRCFLELKQQLDRRLLKARRTTWASAVCLVGRTAALAVARRVLAGAASCLRGPGLGPGPGPGGCGCCRGGDLLARPRWQLREHMDQLDAAARGTFVLHHDLDTIERLAARLHATVESDKMLVRLGLERGRGQRHPIEEVLRHLRKTHPSFLHQLADLDEHICLYLAAINRASSLLLGQIHHHRCRHLTT